MPPVLPVKPVTEIQVSRPECDGAAQAGTLLGGGFA